MVCIESRHMDGTMSAPARDEGLSWVKATTEGNECRILTNVRVLSEGVDVPSLDAVHVPFGEELPGGSGAIGGAGDA